MKKLLIAAVTAGIVGAGVAVAQADVGPGNNWFTDDSPYPLGPTPRLTIDGQPKTVTYGTACFDTGPLLPGNPPTFTIMAYNWKENDKSTTQISIEFYPGQPTVVHLVNIFGGGVGNLGASPPIDGNATATKSGNTYTISGNVQEQYPSKALHSFEIVVTCP
jgi:hypothetical protein